MPDKNKKHIPVILAYRFEKIDRNDFLQDLKRKGYIGEDMIGHRYVDFYRGYSANEMRVMAEIEVWRDYFIIHQFNNDVISKEELEDKPELEWSYTYHLPSSDIYPFNEDRVRSQLESLIDSMPSNLKTHVNDASLIELSLMIPLLIETMGEGIAIGITRALMNYPELNPT